MPRIGDLTTEELLDSADKDIAYLADRLEVQCIERGADPDAIEEVVNRALTTQLRTKLIVAQARLREDYQARLKPAATPGTKPDPDRNEHQAAEAMTALLNACGISAQTINTGGNCWATSITLTETTRLELNSGPSEVWSWSLYQHGGEQVVCGHWNSADDLAVAQHTKALIDAMGSISA